MAIKKSQLYSKLKQSCDQLRGGMDASQYKDYVLLVLFLRYLSDKAKSDSRGGLITLPDGCFYDDLVAHKNHSDVGEKMNKTLAAIEAANADFLRGMFSNVDFCDENKLGKGNDLVKTVSGLIAIFEDPALDFANNRAADDDLIGDAYEYLMKNFASQSGKSKGQFYTPAEVSRVMAKLVGIDKDARPNISIYDPTCGSGSLLLRAKSEARGNASLDGQEKDLATIGMARMSMIIHGEISARLFHGNTLTQPQHKLDDTRLRTFDYVVANPPFSAKSWLSGGSENDPFRRWGHGDNVAPVPPPKNGDYAFLLHVIASTKPDGKGAVILPHGVLFRGNAEAEIRKFILERRWIRGIVGLPPNLFYGTPIPACIIVIDKKNAADSAGIFMIDAKEGFEKDGAKNRLREQDIRKIIDVWNARADVPHYARLVPWAEIEANGCNLNLPRYIPAADSEVRQDIEAHLRGGVPEADIAAELGTAASACPTLVDALFRPLRPGFRTLAVPPETLPQAVAEEPSVLARRSDYRELFEKFLEYFGRESAGIGENCDPKALVAKWGDALLEIAGTKTSLIAPYDAYEVFMKYWAGTLQDDCFLVSRDDWRLDLRRPARRHDYTKFECDLLPPEILLRVRFSAELREIDAFAEKIEAFDVERNELVASEAEDEDPADVDLDELPAELRRRIKELDKKIARAKKARKEKIAALTNALAAAYATLSREEIIDCVVREKWCAALRSRFAALWESTEHALENTCAALHERYAEPLPELEANATALREKLAAHLCAMGFAVPENADKKKAR